MKNRKGFKNKREKKRVVEKWRRERNKRESRKKSKD